MLSSRATAITPDYVLAREEEGRAKSQGGASERGSALRVDDAIVSATQSRAESERVLAEVLAGIERSFQPNDDKRLVCRAYVVQIGRTMGRLRDATLRLEREAADAMHFASVEKAELVSRLHHATLQADSQAKLLQSEVTRSEAERAAHGEHMHAEMERMRREREEESSRLSSDLSRTSAALEASRAETAALWQQAQAQQKTMTKDNEALRAQVASLTSELDASRDAHGIDASTLRAELTLLGAEKQASVARLRSDLAYMTQLASETEARLEANLVMLKVEKETAVDTLRQEMRQLVSKNENEVATLSASLQRSEKEKEATEMELRRMLRRQKAERDEETAALRGKIHRLSTVQKEAMDAGTLRARQILFWNHVKGDDEDPSTSWRSKDEPLPPFGSPGRSTSPSRIRDEYGELIGRASPSSPYTPVGESPG